MKTAQTTLLGYSSAEEVANSVIHGVGALAAAAGLVLLTLRSRGFLGGRQADAAGTASCVLFAGTMLVMFLTSTFYHASRREEVKKVLRLLDHSAIYLLIAGTYTPFCLMALRGAWGWGLFAFEWGMALLGIILGSLQSAFLKKIEIAAYILMGWAMVAGWFPLSRSAPFASLVLLAVGGVLYTLGIFWYRKKNVRGTHAVWHLFVLAGAAFHWTAVWNLVR
ncbi:MAG: hemolysin III family protein, partial [Spirochaetales bacterium]|nr:hemolysin III family protein [Spirochaetales bacterium]